jgi:HK97 gp10 family phage protein
MIRLTIDGIDDLEKALRAVGKKAAREAALVAVQHAAQPVVEAARNLATEDTGALRESIGWRVKPYRRGDKAIAVIGPQSKFRGPDGRQPAKYAHLVEFGHAKKGGGTVAAKPFMRPAIAQASGEAMRTLGETFGVALNIKAEQLAEVRKSKSKKRSK